jgi:hypothetical protein
MRSNTRQGIGAPVRRDRFCRLDSERSDEHPEPAQELLLVVVEQPVTPLDRSEERLLAGQRGPGAAGQQPEPVVQPVADRPHAHGPQSRRRQLDGQGEAVETSADGGDAARRVLIQIERRIGRLRPFNEQLDGVEAGDALRIDRPLRWRLQ